MCASLAGRGACMCMLSLIHISHVKPPPSRPSSIVALVSVTGNGFEPNPACPLVPSFTLHLRDDLSSANGCRPVALLATLGRGPSAICC
jgi:hypothetical protein